jgi:RNA polymerase Rpb1, domain 2
MAILIRQPCLWSSGIQPVVVKVTPLMIMYSDGHTWDVNFTVRLPTGMCAPFAADFDGDEMTVFPLKRSQSLDECNTFEWDYSRLSNERIHSELLSSRHPRQEIFCHECKKYIMLVRH